MVTQKKLKFEDIRKAYTAYRIVEKSENAKGIRRTFKDLNRVLRTVNLFISEKKANIWLDHVRTKLENKKYINLHEFLYLICN